MIDTHAHLEDDRLIEDVEQIVADFDKDGLQFVINNSCNLQSMTKAYDLAQKYSRLYCTVGMHPHDAKEFDQDFADKMTAFAQSSKVVAVGEIGLDYYYDLSDRKVQRDVFAQQIEIADKLGLPITLHIRDAYGDALDVLTAQKSHLNNGVLWHCYSGSTELARQMSKKGHYFAFGGAITFKNANKDEVIRSVPIEQVLSETDCPYMTPVPFRGKTNYPKYVRYVVEKLAATYGVGFDKMEEVIEQNCKRIFTKIQ